MLFAVKILTKEGVYAQPVYQVSAAHHVGVVVCFPDALLWHAQNYLPVALTADGSHQQANSVPDHENASHLQVAAPSPVLHCSRPAHNQSSGQHQALRYPVHQG